VACDEDEMIVDEDHPMVDEDPPMGDEGGLDLGVSQGASVPERGVSYSDSEGKVRILDAHMTLLTGMHFDEAASDGLMGEMHGGNEAFDDPSTRRLAPVPVGVVHDENIPATNTKGEPKESLFLIPGL
jgi:hypothetical protein